MNILIVIKVYFISELISLNLEEKFTDEDLLIRL